MIQIDDNQIALHWTTEDVMQQCNWLTKKQAQDVLHECLHGHDANIGVNWDVIECIAEYNYPEPT
tara:strand:- start:12 stop:206 length:195 start_codon:yes stop_codon:yes gene_type:complete